MKRRSKNPGTNAIAAGKAFAEMSEVGESSEARCFFPAVDWSTVPPERERMISKRLTEMLVSFFPKVKADYRLLTESKDSRDLRQVAEWIQQHSGTVRARDLVSGRRDIESSEQADELLQRLVDNDFGSWRPVGPTERGGRPTREFTLFAEVHAD